MFHRHKGTHTAIRMAIGAIAAAVLAACTPVPPDTPPVAAEAARDGTLSPAQAVQNFAEVLAAVEPVAEAECARRTQGVNCDFRIVVDADPRADPNAFQSLSRRGRPQITFTIALIADVRNADELAFILGHEAAHHIAGHLPKQVQTAALGASIIAAAAADAGATNAEIARARQIGAVLGARVFSQEMELEADALGTLIAARAGYDPILGSAYFSRIPDPGDNLLATHPPNAERKRVVRQAARGL